MEVKDLCSENYKITKDKLEDRKKEKSSLSVQRINIFKLSTLPKATYRSNVMPSKIKTTFFSDLEKKNILKLICKYKETELLNQS